MPDDNIFARTARAEVTPLWKARLRKNKNAVLPTAANAMVIFTHDPELVGMLGMNDFSSRPVLLRPPPETEGTTTAGPFPRAWEEADRVFALAYLQRTYSPKFRPETVAGAMIGAAVGRPFHPVREYLACLKWDGVKRLGTWLVDVFGTDQDPYHHAVGTKFLQAAVRRVRLPGCKFDSVLILEGPQDIGKSRACRILFGDEWFTDNLPADLSGRDMSDALQGIWGIEFAEIEHLLRTTPEAIKAFLSREVDRYHPRYGRLPVERPRQCVFIGTTNSDDYARDSTGNRRLWPVRCEGRVNTEWLRANRDQLWAEAAATEPAANLWLDEESVREEAIRQQNARREEDPWEGGILQFVSTAGDTVLVPDILTNHLQLTKDRQDKRAQMRVAAILRRAGWRRSWSRTEGGRFWERPS